MNRRAALGVALLAAILSAALGAAAARAAAARETAAVRVEARSAHYRLVGLLRGDTMSLQVSRLLDNAPVRNAVVKVEFRGRRYPTTATVAGGYSFSAPDLHLPGSAAIAFTVDAAGVGETLDGIVRTPARSGKSVGHSGARQLGWWVLNFAVCIGFLALIARRRKRNEG
ncbi:MAG TPA: hypothetical protein VND80_02870 [Steroidobacteraceae bacterium]|nr:hypothetical protein [Steroidobacteraceae bacterium]